MASGDDHGHAGERGNDGADEAGHFVSFTDLGLNSIGFTIRSPSNQLGRTSMKKTSLMSVMAAPLLAFALTLPTHAADATAPTTCKDGTTSNATGKGACSGHGGVQKAMSSTTSAAPAPATAPAAPAAPAASGGPTTCKDGTTSSCHRQGCMQRSWRRAKSDQVHAGGSACRGCSGPRCDSCARNDRREVDSDRVRSRRRLRRPATPTRPVRRPSAKTEPTRSRSIAAGPARATAASPSG